ncbi:MAG: DUF2807 domain-containing protein [Dehalococcoidales bacterium]
MRKTVLLTILVAALVAVGLAGCLGAATGSGKLITEEMSFSGFTRVEVSHAFEVEISRSSSYSVSITADDNLFDYVEVFISDETLKIRLKSGRSYISATLEARITMPELRRLQLSGASRGTVSGFSSLGFSSFLGDFRLELSGASSLQMVGISAGDARFDISEASRLSGNITAADARFDISGASRVELEGSADDIIINVSGASNAELSAFPVNNAFVNLSGASTGTVNLDGRLDVDLSGASHLDYIGEPTLGEIDISGGSTISRQ